MENFSLREFRKANDLTQKDIADYVGTTPAYICKIEKKGMGFPALYLDKILSHPTWNTSMLVQSKQRTVEERLLAVIESQQNTIDTQAQTIRELEEQLGNVAAYRASCAAAR